jgi:uncharacterized protein
MTVMRQSWVDVAFLHWRYEPAIVRPLVPRALDLDLHDGAAWVTLVPFTIEGPVPYLTSFAETNVRTYARDRAGGNGVWFFSLDAARLLAVIAARTGYALPYFWSRMRVRRDGQSARYTSRRLQGPRASSDVEIRIGEPIVQETALDTFLTMRLRLYAHRLGRIWKADVAHPPWPLQRATATLVKDSLLTAGGLPKPAGEPLVHYAKRVDVSIGPLVAL